MEIEEAFEVREAMTMLPEACQEILDRFFARDQSYKTISSELEFPPGRSPAASPAASESCVTSWRHEWNSGRPGCAAAGFRDLRERNPRSRISFCADEEGRSEPSSGSRK